MEKEDQDPEKKRMEMLYVSLMEVRNAVLREAEIGSSKGSGVIGKGRSSASESEDAISEVRNVCDAGERSKIHKISSKEIFRKNVDSYTRLKTH